MENKKKNEPLVWIGKYLKKHIGKLFFLSVISAGIAGSFIVLAIISSQILDGVMGTGKNHLLFDCLLLAVVILLLGVLNVVNSRLRVSMAGQLDMDMKATILRQLFRKNYLEVSRFHSGEIMNRFTSDIDIVVSGITGIIPQMVTIATKLIFGMTVLFFIDPLFTMVILIIGVTVGCTGRLYSKKFQYIHKEMQEKSGKVRSFMQECVENIMMIKSFSNAALIEEKLEKCQQDYYKVRVKKNTISNLANTCAYVAFTAGYYGALAWGAIHIAAGTMTFGKLAAFLQIVNQMRMPFLNVSGLLPQYYSMLSSAQRLIELEELEDEKYRESSEVSAEVYNKMEEIVFEHIEFAYGDTQVFRDLSVHIPKSGMTAIVGISGKGKSTMMKLLLGLVHSEKGELYLRTNQGCIPIDERTRSLFAYVPQGNIIFSGTIGENIAFSRKEVTEQEIMQAAETACLTELIEQLPNGLHTVLGERGRGLSEGQTQRIAIARAVLSEAPVLLLDECTSALDEETERKVMKNLQRLKTKTIICISHRAAISEECDWVIKIDG